MNTLYNIHHSWTYRPMQLKGSTEVIFCFISWFSLFYSERVEYFQAFSKFKCLVLSLFPRVPHNTLYPQRLALTSPTSGGCSVCIVRMRTTATEFSFSYYRNVSISNCMMNLCSSFVVPSYNSLFTSKNYTDVDAVLKNSQFLLFISISLSSRILESLCKSNTWL
jgi:hypothetical protein